MTVQAILAPVFAQVVLTLVLAVLMMTARISAERSGSVSLDGVSSRSAPWPEAARKRSDSFHNQFELPVLFYVAVIVGLITRQADLVFVVLSWIFVALRCLHALEHVGPDRLTARFAFFAAGALVLAALWIYLALKIYALA